MRQYHSTIHIDGSAPSTIGGQLFTPDPTQAMHYETQVAGVLDILKESKTGQAVLREIMHAPKGRAIRIIPFPLQDATTVPSDPLGAAPRSEQLRFAGDDPRTSVVEQAGQRRVDAQNQPLLGTGEGANVTIHYHPLTWLMDSFRTGMVGKLMPDDVLLHELVHALRMMSGMAVTLNMGSLRHTQRWSNTEEFYAVLIANTYVSERNGRYGSRQPLRGNVGPVDQFTPLSGDEARSQEFLKIYRPLLKNLCDQMIGLTHGGGQTGVQHAPAEFNPIRDYLKEWDDLRMRMYGGF